VWRCPLPWFRILCLVVNQVFSIGILLSWRLAALLAVTYWRESLLVLAVTGIGSFWLFRRRRRERPTRPGAGWTPAGEAATIAPRTR